ncbi:MAG: IS110 family transposase [Bdellovibrionales bacterium]
MSKLLGIDLAKESFYFCAVNDDDNKVLMSKKVARKRVLLEVLNLEPDCIYMEACGGAHYWAREFIKLNIDVKLIPAQDVKPFVKGQKNDKNDGFAIIEAGRRPRATVVGIKTESQQDIQSLHRVRDILVRNRVSLSNQLRGLLMEYGYTFPKGSTGLMEGVRELLCKDEFGHSHVFLDLVRVQFAEILETIEKEKNYTNKLKEIAKQCESCKRLMSFPGVGFLTATLFLASAGDARNFRNGRHGSAWLGLVPGQRSTGGKTVLTRLTKSGDKDLRRLVVQGARAKVISAMRKGDLSKQNRWINEQVNRKGFNSAAISLANKNVRGMIAILKNGGEYIDI